MKRQQRLQRRICMWLGLVSMMRIRMGGRVAGLGFLTLVAQTLAFSRQQCHYCILTIFFGFTLACFLFSLYSEIEV